MFNVANQAEIARIGRGGDPRVAKMLSRLETETPLWQGFLLAHRRIVELMAEQTMRDHALPLDWFDVLIHLVEMPDLQLRQRDLRDRLLLSESGVSRLLVRMERNGLVARAGSDNDRRGIQITLTDRGLETVLGAVESHLQLVAELFTDRLTASDRTALGRVVAKLHGPGHSGGDQP